MRKLVTCPICNTDQHVYANKIVKHDGIGPITCTGSGRSIDPVTGKPKRILSTE